MLLNCLLLIHALFSPNGRIELRETGAPGSSDLFIGSELWFAAGTPPSFRANGAVLKLQCLTTAESQGHDALGSFARRVWSWCAGACTATPSLHDLHFETGARVYDAAVVMEQRWLNFTKGTSAASIDALASAFPSFALPGAAAAAPARAFLQYGDEMAGAGSTALVQFGSTRTERHVSLIPHV